MKYRFRIYLNGTWTEMEPSRVPSTLVVSFDGSEWEIWARVKS